MPVNTYETVFIANPEIANEAVDALLSKLKAAITDHKGTVTHEDRWGRRRLAYPIHGFREGFYVVLNFNADGPVVAAMEHVFRVTDSVIRHMTIRIIKKNKVFAPRRVKPVGAVSSPDSRSGGRPGYTRPSSPAPAPTAPSATAPAAPAAPAPAAPAPAAPEASA